MREIIKGLGIEVVLSALCLVLLMLAFSLLELTNYYAGLLLGGKADKEAPGLFFYLFGLFIFSMIIGKLFSGLHAMHTSLQNIRISLSLERLFIFLFWFTISLILYVASFYLSLLLGFLTIIGITLSTTVVGYFIHDTIHVILIGAERLGKAKIAVLGNHIANLAIRYCVSSALLILSYNILMIIK